MQTPQSGRLAGISINGVRNTVIGSNAGTKVQGGAVAIGFQAVANAEAINGVFIGLGAGLNNNGGNVII